MTQYPSLRDAVLDLDPTLIETLAAFSIERRDEGLLVLFRFAFFVPSIENPQNMEQCPDLQFWLPGDIDPREEIQSLEECGIAGEFNAVELAPGVYDNPTDAPKWVVKTHAGSQAERIQWRNSIG